MLPVDKVVPEVVKEVHKRMAGATPGTVRPLLRQAWLCSYHAIALGWRAGAAHSWHAAAGQLATCVKRRMLFRQPYICAT